MASAESMLLLLLSLVSNLCGVDRLLSIFVRDGVNWGECIDFVCGEGVETSGVVSWDQSVSM